MTIASPKASPKGTITSPKVKITTITESLPPPPQIRMNQPIQPPATLNIVNATAVAPPPSTKYLDLARKIKEIEMVKTKEKVTCVFFLIRKLGKC